VVWETRIKGDPDDRETVFISDYVTELFGYDPEEYKAKPGLINELIVEDQREWFAREMRELITNGNERVLPFKIRTKSGMEKWVQGHVAVVRDESGASVGIRGVTMDITERKVIEERLAAKQLQLTEAQRLAQVGSWEWDERTGVVTWSDEIYHIYGRDPSQPAVTFEEHKQLLVPDSWERLGLEVENTLKTGEPYEIEIELPMATRGGALHEANWLSRTTEAKSFAELCRTFPPAGRPRSPLARAKPALGPLPIVRPC
jgi:PAS domain S-box-containing protein